MVENFSALYYTNPYQDRFTATVMSIEPAGDAFVVVLSQSCFYPEGGGQPGDRGYLCLNASPDGNRWEVYDTRMVENQVGHFCRLVDGLSVGQEVSGQIDWTRRYEMMQLHSAEHIFSGLVNKHHGYNNVGFHINEELMYFDFDGYLDEQQLQDLVLEVNQVIQSQQDIQVSTHENSEIESLVFRSKKAIPEALRLVTIAEVDVCACCGTQLKNTGEIGVFIVTEALRYKSGVRIAALAGMRAIRYLNALQNSAREASRLLSVKPVEIGAAVKIVQQKQQFAESQNSRLSRMFFEALKAQITADMKQTYRYFIGFSDKQVKEYCKIMSEEHQGVHIGLRATDEAKRLQYFVASGNVDLHHTVELINVALNGKGGGRGGFAQGTIAVDYATARSYFDVVCSGLDTLIL